MIEDSAHIKLWNQCLDIIKDILPAEQFNLWFKDNIKSLSYADGCLTLWVPSSFYAEVLDENYIKVLVPVIKKVYGMLPKVVYSFPSVSSSPSDDMKVRSANPSGVILAQKNAKPASPFADTDNQQIDPQLNARYTFDNYMAGESNKVARTIGMAIANDPKNLTFNPLFVFGPTGVGKTHLIQAIGIGLKEKNPESRVLYVTARLFESQYTAAVANKETNNFFHFYQGIDTLIIDDVQDLHNKPGTQNTFFHIFNHLHQNNKHIIMSSDAAPSDMEGFEDRLLSRFKWGMSAELTLPDLDLRRAVLKHNAEINGLDIPDDVAEYIATNVTSSLRELEGVVVALMAYATVNNSDISLELAQSVLGHTVKVAKHTINFEMIADSVCSFYNLDIDRLFTKNRERAVSDARQVVMYLAKHLAKMSIVAIGHKIDRTHATVNHACKTIAERLVVDRKLQQDISAIEASLQMR